MAGLRLVIGNKNYSSWSMRPWLALRANNIPFEETFIPLYTGTADKQRILDVSPAGKVPVLVDGDVTVIDITSSRMLMAYGFLRRVFEVFERYRTPVDVVTTSEVSLSVTIDERRHLDVIVEALSEFATVDVEGEMALLCAVGDRLQHEPTIAARAIGVLEEVPLRMISQAASRRNITVILRHADLAHAMQRLHAELIA